MSWWLSYLCHPLSLAGVVWCMDYLKWIPDPVSCLSPPTSLSTGQCLRVHHCQL